MEEKIKGRACELFSALSHPTRLKIAECLVQSPLTVNEISRVAEISQSNTSQHLAILFRSGLITVHQSGTTRTYAVRGPRIGAILRLIEEYCTVHGLEGSTVDSDEEWVND